MPDEQPSTTHGPSAEAEGDTGQTKHPMGDASSRPAGSILQPGAQTARSINFRSTLDSLKNRNFRWLWLALLASFSAMQMQMVARGWLVYELTSSPLALGIVSFAAGVPILIISPLGGVIADRVTKRNLLVITQSATGVITMVIAVLISSEVIEFWHLAAAALLAGAVLSFDMPARQAIVPELVSSDELMNAIALNSSAMNLTRIVGPALAGVLVGIIAISGVYYLIAFCYVVVVFFLLRIQYSRGQTTTSGTPWGSFVEGMSFIRNNSTILALLILAFLLVIMVMPYMMLLPVFAADVYHVGAEGLGIMMGVSGIGALVGSLGVAALGNYERKGLLLLGSGTIAGASLAFFGLSQNFLLALVFLLIAGLAGAVNMAVNNTLLMSHVPGEIRGRVMSIYMMTFGMAPIATLPAGAVAEIVGVQLLITIGGSLVAAFMLIVALSRPNLRRLS
jgi:MFS family permease